MLRPCATFPELERVRNAAVGSHTLQVTFTTQPWQDRAQPPWCNVTLVAPPVSAALTVHIDSPTDGTVVTGLHSAFVTATTDPAGNDRPASTRLYLDGVLDSSATCASSATTCSMNHLYDVSGLVGTLHAAGADDD